MFKNSTQMHYNLESYRRSNQDTCLVHKPALNTGEWVESGDLLADSSASKNGELALGKNIIVAYMPWEGYNYEDAILINERLVYDDAYTSVHIERYEIETKESQYSNLDSERITRNLPDLKPEQISHLDNYGIAKIGSWVEEGDILVGKVTPINPKKQTGYQKLIFKLFERKANTVRDSSLRAPKSIKANVIDVQILGYTYLISLENLSTGTKANISDLQRKEKIRLNSKAIIKENNKSILSSTKVINSTSHISTCSLKTIGRTNNLTQNPVASTTDKNTTIPQPLYRKSKWLPQENSIKINQEPLFISRSASAFLCSGVLKHTPLRTFFGNYQKSVEKTPKVHKENAGVLTKVTYHNSYAKTVFSKGSKNKLQKKTVLGNASSPKRLLRSTIKKHPQASNNMIFSNGVIPTNVHLYLAEKRKIQVGDKMAGRHGNKGIISNILPRQDMPYLPDGTPLDIVLNPLGVPSRMNVGQIYECLLGLAGKYLGEHYKIYPFDEMYGAEASRSFVFSKLFEARQKTGIEWLFDPNSPGKIRIFDGRDAQCFDQPVTVGIAYMLKLVHMVDDKLHARSTGPYSLVTQQPLRGRAKQGGQRLGEMEVWAIEGYGAAFVLLEMLTLKSDDMTGRLRLWSDLILNKDITLGTPESFKVLVCELQALCLDIGLFRGNIDNEHINLPGNKTGGTSTTLLGQTTTGVSKATRSFQLKEITNLMFLP